MTSVETDLEQRAINVIRGLAMDAPQAANAGHPGTAMALAPLAHVLWTRIMRYDASDPEWPDRDRFVLSCGHACILLYSMLHLTGYNMSLDDLRAFRQWGSRTPGHPEVDHARGIEVTTGPLGQGFANAVGLGVAERWLRTRFGPEVCDHHTFVICSDGDLEEGISHEAASLAGHLGLGRLVYVYDNNHISIDGPTELALSDDPVGRFRAYGWHAEDVGEIANDTHALEAALRRAIDADDRPSLIVLRSHIGYPSPNFTDNAEAHGSPLGEEEVRTTKEILGLPPDETFYVPDDVLEFYREAGRRGHADREQWQTRFDGWNGDKGEWEACQRGEPYDGWSSKLPRWEPGEKLATRKASNACLDAVADLVPGLVTGSADLTGNTGVKLGEAATLSADEPGGRQIHFGIREHAMGAVMSGMAEHGGILPVGGTFLVFSDYMRPAVRLAALGNVHVVYSWTHDSVGLGEDGPTHQPIEHLAALRAMPGLRVVRPADANETATAWRVAIEREGPTALILTRQSVPVLEGTAGNEGVLAGAYVLDEVGEPSADLDLVLVGTGSEVSLCVDAAHELAHEGFRVRVVSMPSWELFDEQDDDYTDDVLPPDVPVLAVEAAATFGWDRWADDVVGLDRFGASAPGSVALENLGFNVDNVVARARELLGDASPEGLDLEEAP